MVRVTFSPEARRDLLTITDYLSDVANPQIARRYEAEIRRVIENLRDLPSTGSPRPSFGANVRLLVVKPYLIFYDDQSERDAVEILRILHGSRNITRDMLKPGIT